MLHIVDREALARALARAADCAEAGDQDRAEMWAIELVRLLGCGRILAGHPAIPPDRGSSILRNPGALGACLYGQDG